MLKEERRDEGDEAKTGFQIQGSTNTSSFVRAHQKNTLSLDFHYVPFWYSLLFLIFIVVILIIFADNIINIIIIFSATVTWFIAHSIQLWNRTFSLIKLASQIPYLYWKYRTNCSDKIPLKKSSYYIFFIFRIFLFSAWYSSVLMEALCYFFLSWERLKGTTNIKILHNIVTRFLFSLFLSPVFSLLSSPQECIIISPLLYSVHIPFTINSPL